jgi:hypothetical protein
MNKEKISSQTERIRTEQDQTKTKTQNILTSTEGSSFASNIAFCKDLSYFVSRTSSNSFFKRASKSFEEKKKKKKKKKQKQKTKTHLYQKRQSFSGFWDWGPFLFLIALLRLSFQRQALRSPSSPRCRSPRFQYSAHSLTCLKIKPFRSVD